MTSSLLVVYTHTQHTEKTTRHSKIEHFLLRMMSTPTKMIAAVLLCALFTTCTALSTVGSGCLFATFSPSSGTQIPPNTDLTVTVHFSAAVRIRGQGNRYTPLKEYAINASLDLAQYFKTTPYPLHIRDITRNAILVPESASTNADGTRVNLMFNGTDIVAGSELHLLAHEFFALDAGVDDIYLMQPLGSTRYWVSPAEPSLGDVPPQPLPNFHSCPLFIQDTPLPEAPSSNNALNPGTVHTTILHSGSVMILSIEASFTSWITTNLTVVTAADESNNVYHLQPVHLTLFKGDTIARIPVARQKTIVPMFEEEVAISSFSEFALHEVTRSEAQSILDIIRTDTTCSTFIDSLSRPYEPYIDFTSAPLIESLEYEWRATVTCPNGITMILWSTVPPRHENRWFVAHQPSSSGFVCPQGSRRNYNCPNCLSVTHRLGMFSNQPYACYSFDLEQATVDENFHLSVSVDGRAQCSTLSQNCTGVSTTILGTNTTHLYQIVALENVWLVAWDPKVSESSPARWRLIPTAYFGGGLNKLDTTQQDFYLQHDRCNVSYQTGILLLQTFLNNSALSPFSVFEEPQKLAESYRIKLEQEEHLVLTYDTRNESITLHIELPAEFIHILQPQLSIQSADLYIYSPTNGTLLVNITNTDVTAHCDAISTTPARLFVRAGSTEVVYLPLILDFGLSFSGTSICRVKSSVVDALPLWVKENMYDEVQKEVHLINGCWQRTQEAYILFNESTWLDESNLDATIGTNPLELTITNWTRISNNEFARSVSVHVTNGGDTAGDFVAELSCDEGTTVTEGPFIVQPNAKVGVSFSLEWKGTKDSSYRNCSVSVSIAKQQCWSTIGKKFTFGFEMDEPIDECLNIDTEEEPSLFFPIATWRAMPSLSITNQLNISQTEWYKCDDSDCKVVSVEVRNGGTETGVFAAEFHCYSSTLEVTASTAPKMIASGHSATFEAVLSSNASLLQQEHCYVSLQILKNISVLPDACWSTYGKVYIQSFTVQATATTTDLPAVDYESIIPEVAAGAGVGAAVLILVSIVSIILWVKRKRQKRSSQSIHSSSTSTCTNTSEQETETYTKYTPTATETQYTAITTKYVSTDYNCTEGATKSPTTNEYSFSLTENDGSENTSWPTTEQDRPIQDDPEFIVEMSE